MRKFLYFLTAMFLCVGILNAQSLKSVLPASQFSDNLNKVVTDFKNNYYKIQGEELTPEGNMNVYRANISILGSVNSVIYRFSSKLDSTASYQALMFQGEIYEEAMKAYKNTSRLLNKSRLTVGVQTAIGFSGQYIEPEPTVAFANSSFKLNSTDPVYSNFYAEIEMVNTGFQNWEVRLNLHSKKKDDEDF
jgi:hypothetical protein